LQGGFEKTDHPLLILAGREAESPGMRGVRDHPQACPLANTTGEQLVVGDLLRFGSADNQEKLRIRRGDH
jgi:hypothetical protein